MLAIGNFERSSGFTTPVGLPDAIVKLATVDCPPLVQIPIKSPLIFAAGLDGFTTASCVARVPPSAAIATGSED